MKVKAVNGEEVQISFAQSGGYGKGKGMLPQNTQKLPLDSENAILAGVRKSMLLKAGQPVAKDEFWDAVEGGEVRQFNR